MSQDDPGAVKGQEFVFNIPGHEELWQKVKEQDPEDTARKCKCHWLGRRDFKITLIGGEYLFKLDEHMVIGPLDRLPPDRRVVLSLLNYLAGASGPEVNLSGRLVPEKVLPGGDRFFTGGHALSRRPILEAYGQDGAGFLDRASRLGAEIAASETAARSISLMLLPKIPVQVTLSEQDEEFPAELFYAFDASAADLAPLGIISALIGLLNDQLAAWR